MIYFKPQAELTFQSVVAEREKLYALVKNTNGQQLNLDLSAVTVCDSAGLALLLEARKLCDRLKKKFQVIGMSESTRALAEFCGVKTILEV